jgi:hypothetical protein
MLWPPFGPTKTNLRFLREPHGHAHPSRGDSITSAAGADRQSSKTSQRRLWGNQIGPDENALVAFYQLVAYILGIRAKGCMHEGHAYKRHLRSLLQTCN